MKVIKISDQAYARVCQVAAEHGTYLADALDLVVFKGVGTDASKAQEPAAKRTANRKSTAGKSTSGTKSRGRKATGASEEDHLGVIGLRKD